MTVAPSTDPADTRRAEVVYVSMEANPSSHTFLARAAIPNPRHRWRAGMKMIVALAADAPDVPAASPPPRAK